MSDEVLTLRETAELTKFAVQTLRNMRWRGEGPPSFLVSGRLRYRRSAVEQWLAEQEEIERDRPRRRTERDDRGRFQQARAG
jgi:predicted DNA-binding transcriptional regulator AlpA